jgi:hypothetical protein
MKKIINVDDVDDYLDNHAMTDREIKISSFGRSIWQDPSHSAQRALNISNGRKGIIFSDEHKSNISKSGQGRIAHNKGKSTPEYVKEKQRKSHKGVVASNRKPCKTPFGIFISCSAAGEMYNQLRGVTNGINAVYNKIKNQKEGYYYISKEEYTRLTGKEL